MKKPQFVNNEIYHIYNRGVEKRNIFLNQQDYFRFIHDLFEFNDKNPSLNTLFYFNQLGKPPIISKKQRKPRKLLVEILAFCLMPNHFHLLLKQRREGGLVCFMQKLGTGYTNYFNKKHDRVGGLFQGRFKAVHVDQQQHFDFLLYYIHLNPLDLMEPGWRNGEIKNYQKAIISLSSYRWSSHLDYLGKKNFPSVTQREFPLNVLGGGKNYKESIEKWLKEISRKREEENFKKLILD